MKKETALSTIQDIFDYRYNNGTRNIPAESNMKYLLY